MPDAGLISDLVLGWILSFSPLLPGCALQRISLVFVKDEDDLIKASREVHQSVIEAYTENLHCHYSCWFRCHFLDNDHAIYNCNLPTVIRGICISLYGVFIWLLVCFCCSTCCQILKYIDKLGLVIAWQHRAFGEKSALGVSVIS